jgi:hypothetical protein
VARDDCGVRQHASKREGQSSFMIRMAESEQQRDRDRLRRELLYRSRDAFDFLLCEVQNGAIRSHALVNADHVLARHERRRMIARQIVQGGPVLAPQPQ